MGWIRSKPISQPFALRPQAGRHLFASLGAGGAQAVARALAGHAAGDVRVLHAGAEGMEFFGALPGEWVVRQRGADFLLSRLAAELRASPASVVLLAAGPEAFAWECLAVGRAAGLSRDQLVAEVAGSAARRVTCVHCKTLTPDVTTSVFACPGCGQALFVRDHFSRALAAYVGVRIDAESPGDVPAAEVLYA